MALEERRDGSVGVVMVMLERGMEASDSKSRPPREGESLLSGTE